MNEPADPTWHLEALSQDRAVLTEEILRFLMSMEGRGYSPETIGRCLGPIFGLYVRDHYNGNPKFGTKDAVLSALPATMKPELIDDFAKKVGYLGSHRGA